MRGGGISLAVGGVIVLALVGAIGAMGARGAMGAAGGHHSVLAFDGATPTTIAGTVVRVLWQNPHTLVALDVRGERWTVESEGATVLRRLGWAADSIRAGDRVTIIGARAKDGRRLMRCRTITMTDGHPLPCFGGETPEHGDSRP